jgi:hypothetical protein
MWLWSIQQYNIYHVIFNSSNNIIFLYDFNPSIQKYNIHYVILIHPKFNIYYVILNQIEILYCSYFIFYIILLNNNIIFLSDLNPSNNIIFIMWFWSIQQYNIYHVIFNSSNNIIFLYDFNPSVQKYNVYYVILVYSTI